MLRSALLAACLLLAFTAVHAQAVTDGALSVPGCSFDGHDFSSLAGTDLSGSDGTSKYAYYLSICGALTSASASDCSLMSASASACQVEVQSGTQSIVIGEWKADSPAPAGPQWSYIDENDKNKGIMYSMQGDVKCWAMASPKPYVANVHFVCAEEQGALTIAPVPGTCVQNWNLPTPLACNSDTGSSSTGAQPDMSGAGAQPGLSGAWLSIMILALLSLVLATQ